MNISLVRFAMDNAESQASDIANVSAANVERAIRLNLVEFQDTNVEDLVASCRNIRYPS